MHLGLLIVKHACSSFKYPVGNSWCSLSFLTQETVELEFWCEMRANVFHVIFKNGEFINKATINKDCILLKFVDQVMHHWGYYCLHIMIQSWDWNE